jgi:hypothetical protein
MTKLQKYLLVTSVLLIVIAEAVKRVSMPEKLTITVGLIEVVLAASVGAIFGISTFTRDNGVKK